VLNIDKLPPDIARHRVLATKEAAQFCGYSVFQWREFYRSGHVPPPIKLSARKYGWKVGDLIRWIDAKAGAGT